MYQLLEEDDDEVLILEEKIPGNYAMPQGLMISNFCNMVSTDPDLFEGHQS